MGNSASVKSASPDANDIYGDLDEGRDLDTPSVFPRDSGGLIGEKGRGMKPQPAASASPKPEADADPMAFAHQMRFAQKPRFDSPVPAIDPFASAPQNPDAPVGLPSHARKDQSPAAPAVDQAPKPASTLVMPEYDNDDDQQEPVVNTKPDKPAAEIAEGKLNMSVLTYSEALALIEPVIRQVQALDNVNDAWLVAAAHFLGYHSGSGSGEQRAPWVMSLSEHNVVSAIKHLLPYWKDPDFLTMGRADRRNVGYRSYCLFYSLLWNSTDFSADFCRQVIDAGFLDDVLLTLNRKDINPIQFKRSTINAYIAKSCLGILHNCVRLTFEGKKCARDGEVIEILQRYLTSDSEFHVATASIILAHVVNESEMSHIAASEEIIELIVNDLLRVAVHSDDRRSRGFAVDELLDALNALAIHDANKQSIIGAGAVPIYQQIVQAPKDEAELSHALHGLRIISFTEEGKTAIKNLKGYHSMLVKLSSHENEATANDAKHVLWNVTGRRADGSKIEDAPKPMTDGGHVMISYDHQHKEVAHRINERLKGLGYRTWLDVEQMHGSTLDAMAEAVEKAAVVVLCFSERYQNSVNCRAEAQFAYKLEKLIVPVKVEEWTPTGWLSMLLGTTYYVTATNSTQVDSKMKEITRQLGDRGLPGNHVPSDPVATKTHLSTSEAKRPSDDEKLRSWTQKDVKKWLEQNQLSHLSGTFKNFDGALLFQLRQMHRTNPSLFFDNCGKYMGIVQISDMLRLVDGFDKI